MKRLIKRVNEVVVKYVAKDEGEDISNVEAIVLTKMKKEAKIFTRQEVAGEATQVEGQGMTTLKLNAIIVINLATMLRNARSQTITCKKEQILHKKIPKPWKTLCY